MAEEVHAELVGSVLRVEVAPGDVVTPADPLIILESMKMEIPVPAEIAGTILELSVREGQVVTEGDQIAEIAPD